MYLQATYCEKCGAPVIRYSYAFDSEVCTCTHCGNEIVFEDYEPTKKSLPRLAQLDDNDEYEVIVIEDSVDAKIEEYDKLIELMEAEYKKQIIDEVEKCNLSVRYWCWIALVISLVITVFASSFISREILFVINAVWMVVFVLFLIANSYLQNLVNNREKKDQTGNKS